VYQGRRTSTYRRTPQKSVIGKNISHAKSKEGGRGTLKKGGKGAVFKRWGIRIGSQQLVKKRLVARLAVKEQVEVVNQKKSGR